MFQSRFFRNVSFNTLQLIINQFFGLAIFYALSRGLTKMVFGQMNWSLAVLLLSFGVLTFGIDQILVRQIAAGYNRSRLFSGYFFHVLISGVLFYTALWVCCWLFPAYATKQTFLLFFGIGKLGIFISTPFKQLAAGMEKFGTLFLMSVVSNIIRGSILIVLLSLHMMSVHSVVITFIAGDLSELVACIFMTGNLIQSPFKFGWNRRRHAQLIRESLPQTGTVIFTAIMSRFDWILIGLLISDTKLAEYSFAYKIFEVSTLPLLIIAPIMIPLFTRLQAKPGNIGAISFLLKWQVIVASFISLLLNICWIPVIDFISDGKYGLVNATTIFILSLSMPFLYMTNYLWTIRFTQGNLKLVFIIMAISFGVNILCCSLLIPLYKNEGAATAYLITVLVQLILYIQKKTLVITAYQWWNLVCWPIVAILCGFAGFSISKQPIIGTMLAVGLYAAVVTLSGQIRKKDWKILQSLYQ